MSHARGTVTSLSTLMFVLLAGALPAPWATEAARPAVPVDTTGSYALRMTCTSWCGEAGMFLEETVVDARNDATVRRERHHPGAFEKVAEGGPRSAGFDPGPPGRYQIASVAVGQDNQIMIMESILDTSKGEVVSRRWLAPRVFELLDTPPPVCEPAAANTDQLAGAIFGEGLRAQRFIAVLDIRSGEVRSRTRSDTRSPTRRDALCLPAEHWIEPAAVHGNFQLSITPRGPDDRRALVYETVLDTRDGSVVARRRVHQRAFCSIE